MASHKVDAAMVAAEEEEDAAAVEVVAVDGGVGRRRICHGQILILTLTSTCSRMLR